MRHTAAEEHFNTSHVNVNRVQSAPFLACCGYFNTSHVNVNPKAETNTLEQCEHFNTSHVNVNRMTKQEQKKEYTYFNTSHVNVNQGWKGAKYGKVVISIHLMLMLIWMVGLPTAFPISFQYISC